jgi:DNA-binding response OmpR family regulator
LLVEDEPGHAELARRAFEGRGGEFAVAVAETVDAARAVLHGATPPDLVIADWLLPDGEGLDLLRSEPARAMPPVVIMTSHGSERVAVEAIRAGAVDYVVKSEASLADLPHMAERAVRHRRVEQALGDLVAGTAAAGAEALFGELVLRLARALRVKYASVPWTARQQAARPRADGAGATWYALPERRARRPRRPPATSGPASPTSTRPTRSCAGWGRRATWGRHCGLRRARSWGS